MVDKMSINPESRLAANDLIVFSQYFQISFLLLDKDSSSEGVLQVALESVAKVVKSLE